MQRINYEMPSKEIYNCQQEMFDQDMHCCLFSETELKQSLSSTFSILGKLDPSPTELSVCHTALLRDLKHHDALKMLLELLHEWHEASDTVAKLVVTSIGSYLRQQCSFTSFQQKHDRNLLNRLLLEMFGSRTLPEKYKNLLSRTYSQFIYAQHMERLRSDTVNIITTSFGTALELARLELQSGQNVFAVSDSIQDVLNCFIIIQALLQGTIELNLLRQLSQSACEPVGRLVILLVGRLTGAITTQDDAQFIAIVDVLERVMRIYRALFIKVDINQLLVIKEDLMKTQLLQQVVLLILGIAISTRAFPKAIPTNKQTHSTNANEEQYPQFIVVSKGNPSLSKVNVLKRYAFEVVGNSARTIIKNKLHDNPGFFHSIQMCRRILQVVPQALIRQFEAVNYPQGELQDPELYQTAFKALSFIVRIPCFYTQAIKQRDSLIFRVCLPLLQIKPCDLQLSPADYKNIKQDIVNMQCMNRIENSAAKLIQAFVDKTDGSISHFARSADNLIRFQLIGDNKYLSELPPEICCSYFFQSCPAHGQIECCLTLLSLVSYLAPTREDIVRQIENLLIDHKLFFFCPDRSMPLLVSLLLLYTYYSDNFYALLLQLPEPDSINKQQFHRSVLGFCCELLSQHYNLASASFGHSSKSASHCEIVVRQSIDCLSNCLNHKRFLSALYPDGRAEQLVQVIDFLSLHLASSFNIIITELFIEFFEENIRLYLKGQCDVLLIPSVIREKISHLLSLRIFSLYNNPKAHNNQLLKLRLLTLLQRIVLVSSNLPILFESASTLLRRPAYLDENKDEFISILETLVHRIFTEARDTKSIQAFTPVLQLIAVDSLAGLTSVKEQHKYGRLFSIMLSMAMLKISTATQVVALTDLLTSLLKLQVHSTSYNEQLQENIQRTAYLLLVQIYLNHTVVQDLLWEQLLTMICQYFEVHSKVGLIVGRGNDYHGKMLAVCCVHLARKRPCINKPNSSEVCDGFKSVNETHDVICSNQPNGVNSANKVNGVLSDNPLGDLPLGNDVETVNGMNLTEQECYLWRNILFESKIYKTATEKKVVAGELSRAVLCHLELQESEFTQSEQCYRLLVSLNYEITNEDVLDPTLSSMDQSSDDGSSGQMQYWQREAETTRQNAFEQSLPHQIIPLRDISLHYSRQNKDWFRRLVQSLPVALKSFVKQKVMLYQEIQHKSVRRIFKIKSP